MLTTAPSPRCGHGRRERAGQQERREDVDGECLLQRSALRVGGRGRHEQHGGVVDQDVDPATGHRGGSVGQVVNRALVRTSQVGGDEPRRAAGSADVGDHGLSPGPVSTGDDDEGALGGEGLRDGHPETAGRSGDKCCAAGQPRTVWTHESICSADKNGPASPESDRQRAGRRGSASSRAPQPRSASEGSPSPPSMTSGRGRRRRRVNSFTTSRTARSSCCSPSPSTRRRWSSTISSPTWGR